MMPDVAPFSQKSTGFKPGNNVDIVGVTGSIPVTPTIQAIEIHTGLGISRRIYEVAGRFDKPGRRK